MDEELADVQGLDDLGTISLKVYRGMLGDINKKENVSQPTSCLSEPLRVMVGQTEVRETVPSPARSLTARAVQCD